MNRDERKSRPRGYPPQVFSTGRLRAIFPREPAGGSWIGANDRGICLALINWYSREPQGAAAARSRGEIIPSLIESDCEAEVRHRFGKLSLDDFLPFRLIAVFPTEQTVEEWRSDGEIEQFPWKRRHWFSSGFDENEANRIRSATCSAAAPTDRKMIIEWVRQLHRGHEPSKGPFSICMHRDDAQTVSYTEICTGRQDLKITYVDGAPCKGSSLPTQVLPRGDGMVS